MARNNGDTGEAGENTTEAMPEALEAALERARGSLGDEEAWDALEELAADLQRPDEVAELYGEILSRDLPPVLASTLGQRGASFLEEWFGENSPEYQQLLTRVVALDPNSEWAFQRLTIAHTVAGRWDDLLALYDIAITNAIDDDRRISLLSEAANVARDFAQYPDRAIEYLEKLVVLKPDDKELSESLERLLERQERWDDLIAFWSRDLDRLSPQEAHALRIRIAECYLQQLERPEAALEQAKLLLEEHVDDEATTKLLEGIAELEGAEISVRRAALWTLKEYYDSREQAADVVRMLEASLELADREQSVSLHKEAGEKLIEQGLDAEAMKHYAAVLQLEPSSLDALFRLRELAKRTGGHSVLVEALESSAEASESAETRVALRLEAARARRRELGDKEGAIALYTQILTEDNLEEAVALEACRRLGELFEESGQKEEQLQILERLATLEPEAAVRVAVVGRAARLADELGETERALGLWRGRIEANEEDIEALDAMIAILEREEALQALIHALHRRVEAPVPALQRRADLIWIAKIQEERLSELDEAVSTWRRVAEQFGHDAETVDALAGLLSRTGRWDDLAELLNDATARESRHVADMLVWLGDAYRGDLDDPVRAVDFYLRAQRVAPDHQGVLTGLSALLEVEACRATAAETLASAYEAAGQWEEALGLLEARLEGAANDTARVALLRQAAKAQEEKASQPALALGYLAQAFPMVPDDEVLEAELLRLAEETGEWGHVAKALEDAAEVVRDEHRRNHLKLAEATIAEEALDDAERALRAFLDVFEKGQRKLDVVAGVVRTAARLGQWDVVASTVIVASTVAEEVEPSLIRTIEELTEQASAFDAVTAAFDEGLERATEAPAGVVRELDKQVARWHSTRRDDPTASAVALQRAAGRDGEDLEVLRALVRYQRETPNRELFDTLMRIADQVLVENNLDPLFEAAKLALEHLEEAELTVTTIERLYHEGSRLWRTKTGATGSMSPEGATRWAMDELIRIYEESERYEDAVALLNKGAELPLAAQPWREMRKQAARYCAGPLGDRDKAVVLFRGILDETPNDAEVLGELGDICAADGRLPELMALRQHELSLDPDPERALVIRLDIAKIVGELEAQGGRLEVLRANLEQRPGHPETIEILTEVLERSRSFEELADVLAQQAEKLAEVDQEERAAELWSKVAELAEGPLAAPEQAIMAYRKVVEQIESIAALESLARLNKERENYKAAAKWLSRRLKLTEGDERLSIAMELANTRLTAGQTSQAIAVLHHAHSERPESAEIRDKLAALYRETDDRESLAQLLTSAAQYLEDGATLLEFAREAAELYRDLGSPDQAIEVLQKASEAVPDDHEIRNMLADSLLAAKRLEEAEAIYNELIEQFGRRRNAQRAALHHKLARVKQGQGDFDAALEQLEFASSMDVGNTRIMGMLAELSREAGQHDRAERTYRALLMVVRRQPPSSEEEIGEAEVLYELHRLALEREQEDQAEELLRLALKSVSQSSEEAMRFRLAMNERGDHQMLLRALEGRADVVPEGVERAEVFEAIAELLEEHLDRPEDALDKCLTAVEQAPNLWSIHDRARRIADKIGGMKRYVDVLKTRIERARRHSDAELASELLLRLGLVLEEDLDDLDGATEAYTRMEEWGERPGQARIALARVAMARGDGEESIRLLERVVQDEDAPIERRNDARYHLAKLQLGLEELAQQGLVTLQGALEVAPDYERAGEILRESTAARPDDTELLALYGKVAHLADDAAMLLDYLKRRAQMPDVTLAEIKEAVNAAHELEEMAEAEALLERAVQIAEASEEGLGSAVWISTGLAQHRRAAGDIHGALGWMRRAAESIADEERALSLWLEVAKLARDENELSTAAAVYERLLEQTPADERFWKPLLDVLSELGDEERFVLQVNELLERLEQPQDQNGVRLAFAKFLLTQEGREADAADVLRSILDVDRGHKEAYGMLIELFERTGYDEELAELLGTQLEESFRTEDFEAVHSLTLRLGALLDTVRREDAMNAYRRALGVLPNDREIAQALLALFGPDDDPRERVELLERPLATEEGEAAAELSLKLADEWSNLDDDAGVRRVLEGGYDACPEDERLLHRLETWYNDHEEWGALADLLTREATRLADATTSVTLLRNAAALRSDSLGDPAGAATALMTAREFAPTDVGLLQDLAKLRSQANDQLTAIDEIAGALEAIDDESSERPGLLVLRSELFTELGRTAEAVADLEQAQELSEEDLEVTLIRGLEAHRQAMSAQGEGDEERRVTLRLVEILRGRGDREQARELLEYWIGRAPGDLEALHQLRSLEEESENWESVARISSRIVELEEGEAQVAAVLRLADAWARIEQPGQAQAALEAVNQAQPDSSEVRERLWSLYEEIGATEKLASLLVADAIKIEDAEERFNLLRRAGDLYLKSEESRHMAIDPLEEALRLKPGDHDTLILLADACIASQQFEKAQAILEAAIAEVGNRRGPKPAELQSRMAALAEAADDKHSQMHWLNVALDSNKRDGQVAADLAELCMELGEHEVALKALRVLTVSRRESSMSLARAFFYQAKIAHSKGESRQAQMWARRALSEDPELTEAEDFLKEIGAI